MFANKNKDKIKTTDNSADLDPVANIETSTTNDNICLYLIYENKRIVKPGNKAIAK